MLMHMNIEQGYGFVVYETQVDDNRQLLITSLYFANSAKINFQYDGYESKF